MAPVSCSAWLRRFRGGRHLTVPPRRTTQECAHGRAEVVEVHFPQAEQLRVVWENPSPPTPAARCEAFPPAEARRILRNLECHPPPVPGSWGHRKEVRINLKRLSPTYSL